MTRQSKLPITNGIYAVNTYLPYRGEETPNIAPKASFIVCNESASHLAFTCNPRQRSSPTNLYEVLARHFRNLHSLSASRHLTLIDMDILDMDSELSTQSHSTGALFRLLELPGELLATILNWLGPDFFRGNVRRLSVSKTWYKFALTVLHQSVEITSCQQWKRFVSGTDAEDIHPTRLFSGISVMRLCFSFPDRIDRRARERCVPFAGVDGPRLPMRSRNDPQNFEIGNGCARTVLEDWRARCDVVLQRLAIALRERGSLQSFSLRIRGCDEFYPPPISWFVSLEQVTELEIDIDYAERGDAHQLCEMVNSRLPRLKTLKFRAPRTCPRLLHVPDDATLDSLETVLVNMYLIGAYAPCSEIYTAIPTRDMLNAKLCTESHPGTHSIEHRLGVMREKAVELTRRMKNPRMVRILYAPEDKPRANLDYFDALSGHRRRLSSIDSWDKIGVEIP